MQECVCASEEDDVLFEVLCARVWWRRGDPRLCLWANPEAGLGLEVERAGAQRVDRQRHLRLHGLLRGPIGVHWWRHQEGPCRVTLWS